MRTARALARILSWTWLAAACGGSTVAVMPLTPVTAAATAPTFAPPGSDRFVVFISDLHLGVGRMPDTHWHPYEDFRWEREFKLFLDRVSVDGGGRTDLVLNGDTFELWQSVDKDCTSQVRDLGCTEAEALRRVSRVLVQHRTELESLGAFAAAGSNTITIVPGNHDAALLFPSVAQAVLGAIPAPSGRVRIAASGYWLSPDGLVYAEHGHQIGADVNRIDGWPQPFVQHSKGRSVRRSWGEQFVQSFYNRFERKYPIIDNISEERAAVRLGMAAEGTLQAAADSVDFLRFFLLGVSWRQFGQSLRDGQAPEWDVERIQKEGGSRFVVESFPTGDPLRRELERRDAAKRLPLTAGALSKGEIRAICDQRGVLVEQEQKQPGTAPGVVLCPQTNESLRAAFETLTGSRDEIFSEHLKKTYATLGQTDQRFLLFVFSHTHVVDEGFRPLREEKLGWDPRVVNTGAWQRVVSPATVRSWNIPFAEALRRSVESLPACYSVVWVPPYTTEPAADVRSWRRTADGSWDFGALCDE
jgi:hypothetical protein